MSTSLWLKHRSYVRFEMILRRISNIIVESHTRCRRVSHSGAIILVTRFVVSRGRIEVYVLLGLVLWKLHAVDSIRIGEKTETALRSALGSPAQILPQHFFHKKSA